MFENRLRPVVMLFALTVVVAISFLIGPTSSVAASSVAIPGVSASGTPDFSVTVDPLSQTRKRGTGAPYFVTITAINGFNGTVRLSLTGNIPPNGTVSISQPGIGPLNDGEVSIQIAKHSTITGTFAMTIHAVSGTLEHDVNISLTIV